MDSRKATSSVNGKSMLVQDKKLPKQHKISTVLRSFLQFLPLPLSVCRGGDSHDNHPQQGHCVIGEANSLTSACRIRKSKLLYASLNLLEEFP